ncbi:MAG: Flp pilus assembly complex ATPase component TadA [Holophagaceae bacterium]|uniref:Flp pilus assembly complex ATPase component TadA n=1 Tax=Candidatus Geothrix skivensis TaxID=2954439 RepID=A0A9D7XJ41_9BACT|nr:Flp pilus assembly complex ATPase component TadA [Candidatus Geothrix skivensis]
MVSKLGEMLVKAQLITDTQLDEVMKIQRREGGKLGSIVVRAGFCSDQDIVSFLGMQYGVPAADLEQWPPIDASVIALIPRDLAQRHKVLPLQRTGNVLTLAMSDPTDIFAMDDVRFHTGYNVDPVVSSEMGLIRAVEKYYGGNSAVRLAEGTKTRGTSTMGGGGGSTSSGGPLAAGAPEHFDEEEEQFDLSELEQELDADAEFDTADEEEGSVNVGSLKRGSEDAPVVKLVNMVLIDAIKRGASDIHIEPYEKTYRIRFRIDGILMEVMRPNLKLKDPLTSRVKILAKLNIAERRLPQDGRIKLRVNMGGRQKVIDYRVSILPTLFGEKIVLRLLDSDKLMLDLTKLGFEQESLDRWDRQISKPYGMILVTGPTGSGKTNTLYSSIAKLNTVDTNIMTAEDPVEFNFPGINQVQMKEQIGLNFAAALRSFLRQDPNIILVGEIRDFETAEIAIKASLTGHLVLSTLHTNDAPSTINRLMNMGVEPFLVATSVNIICAQRLVRRLCPNCKAVDPHHQPEEALYKVGFTPEEVERGITFFKPVGCEVCNKRGYKGRVGLYEVLEMSETLKDMILTGASAIEIREQGQKEGMITLRRSGCRKVLDGVTTIEEIIRETVL